MNHTKPFCLEHAKAGAPYACRDGVKATILKWDAKNANYPLIGCVIRNGSESAETWCADGAHLEGNRGCLDLVMLPLGYIDGKPVFWDSEVQTKASGVLKACHLNGLSLEHCRWPEPAKQYPVTGMSGADLDGIYEANNMGRFGGFFAVADAALRHAIDSGQLPTKEAYDQCNAALVKAERTLTLAGYTDCGGELWKPPLGKQWTLPNKGAA